MRVPALLLTALLVLSVPTPADAQSVGSVLLYAMPSTAGSIANVSLATNANDTLRFQFDAAAFPETTGKPLRAVFLVLQAGTERIDLSLAANGALWSSDLAVASPNLVKANFSVAATAIEQAGTQIPVNMTRWLDVRSNDTAAPAIAFPDEAGGRVLLGAGDLLGITVSDPLLRQVSYLVPGLSQPAPLLSPYRLGSGALREGSQLVTVLATDRAGNSASRSVTVEVDATAPGLVAQLADPLLQGIPSQLVVNVTDTHNVTVTVEQDGDVRAVTGSNGTYRANVTVAKLGATQIVVQARDAVGNVAQTILDRNVTPPVTDSTISLAEVLQKGPVLGDALTLRVTLAQASGVVPADLNLTYTGAVTGNRTVLVPGPGAKVLDIPFTLPLGKHRIDLTVAAPSHLNETNTTNQNATVEVEVFFGKVPFGNATYYIRGGDAPLPSVAVGPNNTTYPLRLVESGAGAVYQFTLPSNQTVTWNPLDPRSTSSDTATGGDDAGEASEPVPATGAVLLLAVLAALAMAVRRRLP